MCLPLKIPSEICQKVMTLDLRIASRTANTDTGFKFVPMFTNGEIYFHKKIHRAI